MSTGWIYLIASSLGALFGATVNRRDPLAVGLGIASAVALSFVAIYENLWPILPGCLLAAWTLTRRRRRHG
jgi:hypothetical protein